MIILHNDEKVNSILIDAKNRIELLSGKEVIVTLVETGREKRTPTRQEIINIFCDEWEMPPYKLMTKNRKKERVAMRQVLALFMRRSGFSLVSIGEVLGGRDHTTVRFMLETVKNRIECDDNLVMHYYIPANLVFEKQYKVNGSEKIQSQAVS